MTEETKQPVVDETKASATPDAQVDSARTEVDPLDALLAEFDQSTKKPESPSTPTPQPQTDPIEERLKRVEAAASEAIEIKRKADMGVTIKDVRGDLDPNVFDDALVEAWLDSQARNDPRLQQAWVNREANPKKFAEVKQALGKAFAKKFSSLPNREATEDREAVTHAVRSASTKAPAETEPDLGQMSDAEFRKYTRKFGF